MAGYKHNYMPAVLDPRADAEVANAAGQQKDLNQPEVIDPIADILFKVHRAGFSSKQSCVKERGWDNLPNSEKGKYRKIVQAAVQRFRAKHKR